MKKRFIILVQLTPVALSLLLIGAHFLRGGHWLLLFVCLLLVCSLVAREPIIVRVVQGALFFTSIEWLRLAYVLSAARIELGEPWIRLAAILGGVACASFLSIFLFYTNSLKEMYHLGEKQRKMPGEKPSIAPSAQCSELSACQFSGPPASPRFLRIHTIKIILNALSPFVFLLMDSFMGIGVLSLVGVGFFNNYLRKKMNLAGGMLSAEQKKASFLWQTFCMLLVSAAVMTYFYYSLEFIRVKVIILSFIALYTLLIGVAAYVEYICRGARG